MLSCKYSYFLILEIIKGSWFHIFWKYEIRRGGGCLLKMICIPCDTLSPPTCKKCDSLSQWLATLPAMRITWKAFQLLRMPTTQLNPISVSGHQ